MSAAIRASRRWWALRANVSSASRSRKNAIVPSVKGHCQNTRCQQYPRIRFISFTGSKEVGLHINAEAAKTPKGQMWIKRVIAEMGGKDAIIVDRETGNLDESIESPLIREVVHRD